MLVSSLTDIRQSQTHLLCYYTQFFRLYPDIEFQFKLPKHLAGTYYGWTKGNKSCYLSTDMPGTPMTRGRGRLN